MASQRSQVTFTTGKRERAALEPGRQVHLVPLIAAGSGQRHPGVGARASRWRGATAHPTEGRCHRAINGRPTRLAWPSSDATVTSRKRRQHARGGDGRSPPPKPIVIDKYQFKRDGPTYLTDNARTRIFIYHIASRSDRTSDERRRLRREQPRVVARRRAHRILQQPRRQPRSHAQHRRLRRRRQAGLEIAEAHDLQRN